MDVSKARSFDLKRGRSTNKYPIRFERNRGVGLVIDKALPLAAGAYVGHLPGCHLGGECAQDHRHRRPWF